VTGRYAFIGSGIMGGIWIERMLDVGFARKGDILACDISEERLAEVQKRYGMGVSARNSDAPKFGKMLVLAVPPSEVFEVIDEIRDLVERDHIVISLAASVPLDQLEKAFGKEVQVVRIMPNTPSLVGMGMNLVCYGKHVSEASRRRVEKLLGILGRSLEVSDDLINQMTAIAAVGPTYVLPIIDALAVAGTNMGVGNRDALLVAAQTVHGSAGLVLQTGKSPEELKEMTGLRTLNEEDARSMFRKAVDSAYQKLGNLQKKLVADSGQ